MTETSDHLGIVGYVILLVAAPYLELSIVDVLTPADIGKPRGVRLPTSQGPEP